MKTIASMFAAIGLFAAMAVPADASDCSRTLTKSGAKAFFACLDRSRN